jgi:hypothetical protein
LGTGSFLGEGLGKSCVFFVKRRELQLKTQSIRREELVGSTLEIQEIQETLSNGHQVPDFLKGSRQGETAFLLEFFLGSQLFWPEKGPDKTLLFLRELPRGDDRGRGRDVRYGGVSLEGLLVLSLEAGARDLAGGGGRRGRGRRRSLLRIKWRKGKRIRRILVKVIIVVVG